LRAAPCCAIDSRCRRRITCSSRGTGSWCRSNPAGFRFTTVIRRSLCPISFWQNRKTTWRRRSLFFVPRITPVPFGCLSLDRQRCVCGLDVVYCRFGGRASKFQTGIHVFCSANSYARNRWPLRRLMPRINRAVRHRTSHFCAGPRWGFAGVHAGARASRTRRASSGSLDDFQISSCVRLIAADVIRVHAVASHTSPVHGFIAKYRISILPTSGCGTSAWRVIKSGAQ